MTVLRTFILPTNYPFERGVAAAINGDPTQQAIACEEGVQGKQLYYN
jgi:hypothetical protein